MSNETLRNKYRIKELDALRGIAALGVVLFHFTQWKAGPKYGLHLGWMGVDLFFIISGFVILMTLEKCRDWKDFVVSRFSRLYPAYWFAVTFTTILIVLFISDHVTYFRGDPTDKHRFIIRYIANMSMLQYYFNIKNIDGPYWTLLIELVFYFLMLCVFVSGKLKRIEWIGFAFLCLSFVYSITKTYIDSNSTLHKISTLFPLITYFPLFFTGILVYKMKFDKVTYQRAFLFVLCFIVQPFLFNNAYRNKGFVDLHEYIFVLFVFFLFFVLYLKNSLHFIVNRYTVVLGEISYSLYLIHQFTGCSLLIPFFIKSGLSFWISAVAALMVVIGIAVLMNRYIEKPSMAYIRKKYKSYKMSVHAKGNPMSASRS